MWSIFYCRALSSLEDGSRSCAQPPCCLSSPWKYSRDTKYSKRARERWILQQSPVSYHGRKEFFLDSDDILYRRRSNCNHQLIVPATLVSEVIREYHAPVHIAHPVAKRTHDLIALHYWWPGMKKILKIISDLVTCQRKKEDREFVAPLGSVQEPTAPFEVTAMDVSGPYIVTPKATNSFSRS